MTNRLHIRLGDWVRCPGDGAVGYVYRRHKCSVRVGFVAPSKTSSGTGHTKQYPYEVLKLVKAEQQILLDRLFEKKLGCPISIRTRDYHARRREEEKAKITSVEQQSRTTLAKLVDMSKHLLHSGVYSK